MKILVTGGAGFIGSAVVRHIIRDTQDAVINLDKLTYAGNLESLADVSTSDRYAFEQVDICNRAELDRVFALHQPGAGWVRPYAPILPDLAAPQGTLRQGPSVADTPGPGVLALVRDGGGHWYLRTLLPGESQTSP